MSGRRSPQPYAATTVVSPQKSRAEIETLLERHGAASFAFGSQPDRGVLMFELKGRRIKFVVPMPVLVGGYTDAKNEQLIRTRWRALLLVVRAKLEAVATGVTTFEDEFLANIVMADGSSVGEWARPQLEFMYHEGQMPPMLPGGRA
ncbi:MAG: hypothetical protein NVS1B2_16080 [Vulcanimicrobiaceae bacterium]